MIRENEENNNKIRAKFDLISKTRFDIDNFCNSIEDFNSKLKFNLENLEIKIENNADLEIVNDLKERFTEPIDISRRLHNNLLNIK